VPGMDTRQFVARTALETMGVHWFDHRANWLAKVRNVSRLGSQFLGSQEFKFPTAILIF